VQGAIGALAGFVAGLVAGGIGSRIAMPVIATGRQEQTLACGPSRLRQEPVRLGAPKELLTMRIWRRLGQAAPS